MHPVDETMTAPPGRRQRARRGQGDRLREEILDATSALLLERGDHQAVDIRSVCQVVGITPPAVYLHFADKAALIQATCERHFRSLDDFVGAAVAGATDPMDELRCRGRAYVRFGIEHPEQYRILFMSRQAHGKEPPGGELLEACGFAALVDNVTRLVEAGAIGHHDPVLVATGLWTVVHGVTSLAISIPHYPVTGLDALLEHLLGTHMRGLAGP
ncbi:MAG TPA: TetR/AcrR family transcriptional regulator [Acidimicrobiales bacterium]|nr:TetR/AcrR family transcriptional regulator [Acidimicrobiales bacterium]